MRTFSVDELKREGERGGKEPFLRRHPYPFLVLDSVGNDQDDGIFATVGGRKTPAPRPAPKEGQPPNPRARAAAVEKRKGSNAFDNMITLGRAGNNDIALDVSSISKFHAYFKKDAADGQWWLHDAGSSNGTWVDGERLAPSQGRARLRDGAIVQLGPETRGRFFQPHALFELLVPATGEASAPPPERKT